MPSPYLSNAKAKTCAPKAGENGWQELISLKTLIEELAGYEFKYRGQDRML